MLARLVLKVVRFGSTVFNLHRFQGDSGGPLFAYDGEAKKFVQYGLVSAGYGCAAKDSPGLNTDLTKLSDWIEVKMAS